MYKGDCSTSVSLYSVLMVMREGRKEFGSLRLLMKGERKVRGGFRDFGFGLIEFLKPRRASFLQGCSAGYFVMRAQTIRSLGRRSRTTEEHGMSGELKYRIGGCFESALGSNTTLVLKHVILNSGEDGCRDENMSAVVTRFAFVWSKAFGIMLMFPS